MALKIIEDMYEAKVDAWVKIADKGQAYLLQVESPGYNRIKVKSFDTEQTVADIPKSGGTRLHFNDTITEEDFNGFVYIKGTHNTASYNLHREA